MRLGSRETIPDSPLPIPTPLFEDVSAQLNGHAHVENEFGDWDRQYLLPDALSQLGPGVAWFDLDRDGDEDLIVGTERAGASASSRTSVDDWWQRRRADR
jgi:hypothetical protein